MTKLISIFIVALVPAMPLLTSCSALSAKQGIDRAVQAGFQADEQGWAARNIPGVKALSNLIPPPTDSRNKWDEWNKRRNSRGIPEDTIF